MRSPRRSRDGFSLSSACCLECPRAYFQGLAIFFFVSGLLGNPKCRTLGAAATSPRSHLHVDLDASSAIFKAWLFFFSVSGWVGTRIE